MKKTITTIRLSDSMVSGIIVSGKLFCGCGMGSDKLIEIVDT